MTPDEISVKVRQAMVSCQPGLDVSAVTDEQTFADVGMDSLDQIQLMIALDDMHGLMVEEQDIERMRSIADISNYFCTPQTGISHKDEPA